VEKTSDKENKVVEVDEHLGDDFMVKNNAKLLRGLSYLPKIFGT
jgi:hypothetical protein